MTYQAHVLDPASIARHEVCRLKRIAAPCEYSNNLNLYTRAISEEKRKAASEVAHKLCEFVPAGKLESA